MESWVVRSKSRQRPLSCVVGAARFSERKRPKYGSACGLPVSTSGQQNCTRSLPLPWRRVVSGCHRNGCLGRGGRPRRLTGDWARPSPSVQVCYVVTRDALGAAGCFWDLYARRSCGGSRLLRSSGECCCWSRSVSRRLSRSVFVRPAQVRRHQVRISTSGRSFTDTKLRPSSFVPVCSFVGFPAIALLAQHLTVLFDCLATLRPRGDVVGVHLRHLKLLRA